MTAICGSSSCGGEWFARPAAHAVLAEASAPRGDGRAGDIQLGGYGSCRNEVGEEQHDRDALDQFGGRGCGGPCLNMHPHSVSGASGVAGSARLGLSAPSTTFSWLLKAKVLVPALPAKYLRRAPLLRRLDGLLEQQLTVLQAPAGFGKTTALADAVRDQQKRGAAVGWVSLDAEDTPDLFGSYLAYAFEQAGLDLGFLDAQDAWASSPAVQQMGWLVRAIERHEAPCLLVLDEVDCLPGPTVQLVRLMLKRAPPNLHVVLAFRANPGLEFATHVLDGAAGVVGPEALRFSTDDIARFFGGSLSGAELAALEQRTAGWPVALTVYRNSRASGGKLLRADVSQVTENYIGTRLLCDLSKEDRVCLLDLAVFDWIDAELVDDVLGSSAARLRVEASPLLNGLLPPVDTDGTVRRLHPLIREHCLSVLSIEDPDRKCYLHKRIAGALARRGQLTPSWRHARAAGDSPLVGRLIESYGACQLWLREGVTALVSAGRFLTAEITAGYPRLDLLGCVALCLSSKRVEATTRLEAISQQTADFTRDRDGGDAEALVVDGVFTQAVLLGGADGMPPADLEARLPAGGSGDERVRALACARHTMLCIACYERASFEECRRHGLQALSYCGQDMRFGSVCVDTCLGMAAMAQGHAEEASRRYRRARQIARKFFSSDPCLKASIDVLGTELDLEMNREKAVQRRTLKNLTAVSGVWVDIRSTAIAVSAELMLGQYDNQGIIRLLSKAVDDARTTGIRSLSNYMSALLAYYLVEAGRADEAGQVWRRHALPCDVADLLNIERQSWRTMEALSCARVRLLVEQGHCGAAEALVRGLCTVASEHGLTRTLLRGLALSMLVAERGGQPDRALEHLVDFLNATRGVGYVRPLVRHRDISRAVLRRLLAGDLDEELRTAAESMQATVGGAGGGDAGDAPFFSSREIEVLSEASLGLRSKEIASRLGISDEGIRYHLKNIYRKAGVGKRADAVQYARSLGVLS